MTWTVVAETCRQGPCPTLYVNPETGGVRVQGNHADPHMPIPGFEGMLDISKEEFRDLLRQYVQQFPL